MTSELGNCGGLVDDPGMDYRGPVPDHQIGSLLEGLDVTPLRGAESVLARRVVEDSRQVEAGDVFLARVGREANGHAFIAAAEAAGAAAVLADAAGCEMAAGPALRAATVEVAGATLAHRLQGDPSLHLPVVGVTGTNGKTTVSTLIQHLLGGSTACGLLGGVVIDDGVSRRPAQLTTPMAVDVANWLGGTRANHCSAAAMEVSSHALHQGRVDGVRFTAAVFTNLSGDHLDYHGSLESYAATKRLLFEGLETGATAILNMDDPAAASMIRGTAAEVVRCSLVSDADFAGRIVSLDASGTTMRVCCESGEVDVRSPLIGRHNAMNLLQAMAATIALGVPLDACATRSANASSPPGRLESVHDRPCVLVDFAHTDGALESVLRSLREVTSGRIIVVVGCGGDRDRTKRPRMAEVACFGADLVWLTSDNPRSESPKDILRDMVRGVPADRRDTVVCEVDRGRAIAAAIAQAELDDCVLIAGKGHETVQLVAGDAIPFDDRSVAIACLQGRGWNA